MKLLHQSWVVVSVLALSFCNTDKNGNREGKGGDGENAPAMGKVSLRSTSLGSNTNLTASEPEDCQFSLDIYRGNGTCLTPFSFEGHANNLVATSSTTNDYDAASARIGAVSSLEEGEGEILPGAVFFLEENDAFDGRNELFRQYEHRSKFDYLTLSVTYQRIKFYLKSKYVTMLLVSSDQPFASGDIIETCEVPKDQREQDRYKKADILTGLEFKRGDYLFCVKDSKDECQPSEYKWLKGSTLVSTRSEGVRVQPYIVKDEVNCSKEQEDRINIGIGGFQVVAKLEKTFKLWADWSNGVDSVQWKDARAAFGRELTADEKNSDFFETPFAIYYLEDATGGQSEGTNLKIVVDFDTENMLYIDGMDSKEVESASLGEVLAAVYTKHDWVFTKKTNDNVQGWGVEQAYSMGVEAKISLE